MRGLTLGDSALLGAAAGFSPLSLSPALWLDASDAATITSSGGKVSQWANKGSLGAFTQSTSTYQPDTGINSLNGLNVITFSGDYMVSADAASAYKAFSDGTDYILASVLRVGTSSNPNTLYMVLDNHSASAFAIGMSFFYDDRSSLSRNDVVGHLIGRGAPPLTVSNISGSNAMTPNAWHSASLYSRPSDATASLRSAITIDTNSPVAVNTSTSTPSTANPTFQMVLGSVNTALVGFPLTGMIAEIVLVAGVNATDDNRQRLVAYLKTKWGV